MIENREDPEISRFLHLAVDKRPAEELFDIQKDPGCLNNLAAKAEFEQVRGQLSAQLEKHLAATGDPRVVGSGDIYESYIRYSPIRKFPRPQ